MSVEDASARLTVWLRANLAISKKKNGSESIFQFSIRSFIQPLVREAADEQRKLAGRAGMTSTILDETTNTEPIVQAAWELVRHGVILPGMGQVDNHLLKLRGDEFTVTEYGERWLAATAQSDAIPSQPGRFSGFLDRHSHRFRPAYRARSQEALGCYNAALYLACCVMAGAAAEAVFLSLAIAKDGDEAKVLELYQSSRGASEIQKILVSGQSARARNEISLFGDLLKYWRDQAGHASEVPIDEEEAFVAMLLLLRLARFADNNWDELKK